jgi:methylase of polypeptide subunit release factors
VYGNFFAAVREGTITHILNKREFLGFRSGVAEDSVIPGYDYFQWVTVSSYSLL